LPYIFKVQGKSEHYIYGATSCRSMVLSIHIINSQKKRKINYCLSSVSGYPSNVGRFDSQRVIKVLKFKRL